MLECGIDEAGRGPAIGPLVIAGVMIEEEDIPKLKALGVKDSKLLSEGARKRLYPEILKIVKGYKILIVPPAEIDEAVLSEHMNLNKLEAIKSAMIVNQLQPHKVILDCPSNNPQAYVDFFKYYVVKNNSLKIIAEHKADVNYPTVSAASILAKVTRDEEIEKLKKEIGHDFGSGYPSDPTTVEFMKKNYQRYEQIFRKSWACYDALINGKSQKSLSDF